MSPDAPAPPSLRDAVSELVAREFAGHREHQLERFAADASRTLLSMRPAVHDEVTQAVAATLESSARVVRMLAGLGTEHSRTTPDGSGCCRTVPNAAGQSVDVG